MLGFRYLKFPPTTHAIFYKRGKVVREGVGLSFLYFSPTTTLVTVPVGSSEAQFIFEEVTADFQSLTIQGQVTYRVSDPALLSKTLDFALGSDGSSYRSNDPLKLPERITVAVQVRTKSAIQSLTLREALQSSEALSLAISKQLPQAPEVVSLGVEILAVSVLAIRPTPETARALEAETREQLLGKADEAVFVRRNAAVEQERAIKENELQTDIVVEQKKRQIRETELDTARVVQDRQFELEESAIAARVSMEAKNKDLVALQAENERTTSDAKAYATGALMKVFSEMNPQVLQSLTAGSMSPQQLISQAFQQLAQNVDKIGELNLSPDLLREFLLKQ
ncbi:MAG: SPFH domain-containing protein [Verrucomicrobiales bacterium]|nr:SPFH domain-containing protein [Verrucomicrobiales bacterium]